MAPIQFTGALQPKKKSELQHIAVALNLSDIGTKDELQARIKKHLDDHQAELEDNPTFAGLLGRRKRSVQPPSTNLRISEPVSVESKPPSRIARRAGVGALEAVVEITTPAKVPHEVSAYIKQPISPADNTFEQRISPVDNSHKRPVYPVDSSLRQPIFPVAISPKQSISPVDSTPNHSPQALQVATPSSLPPLPPTPSPTKSIIANFKTADVTAIVRDIKQHDIVQSGNESLNNLRQLLSNSRNIWSLTAVVELVYILYSVIPWRTVQIPLSPQGSVTFPLVYPPLSTFQNIAFWAVLLHWFIPTILAPVIIGNLVSFKPDPSQTLVFDPLTASIVRLAAQIAYPYPAIDHQSGLQGLDVLGFQLRVLNASVGLAFSFAETISGAPNAFAQSLRRDRLAHTPSRSGTPLPLLELRPQA